MGNVIMIGCDLHDVRMVLQVACGTEEPVRKGFLSAAERRGELIAWIRELAAQRQAERVVFAYEASAKGFGLYDDLSAAGVECHVLAPTHLPRSVRSVRTKTDDRDARMLLEEVRAFVLAGRPLPAVWVPDHQTRADRELVRQRQELAEDRTRCKNRIRQLFKRWELAFPAWFTKSGEWSRRSLVWLEAVAAGEAEGPAGGLLPETRESLVSLLAVYGAHCGEMKRLDGKITQLSRTERYRKSFRKLRLLSGVGLQTAMVFLTEVGDLARFANRRQLAAYLGLAPSSFESGERSDRKGRITRQGSSRVRRVLCQAAWAAVRISGEWREKYERIRRGSGKRSGVAIVAVMRQLAVTMWHTARSCELEELLEEGDRMRLEAAGPDGTAQPDRTPRSRRTSSPRTSSPRKTPQPAQAPRKGSVAKAPARAQQKGVRPSRPAIAAAGIG